MPAKIKRQLNEQLEVLNQLLTCLNQERVVLSKGTSEDVLAVVYQKRQLMGQLAEVEAKRFQLIKQQTLAEVVQAYPNDQELKRCQKAYERIISQIQQQTEENRLLMEQAREMVSERMTFYTEMIRQTNHSKNTYRRGGGYQKMGPIGAAILERTI